MVSFFTTSRQQLGAEFEGKKFHKNYLGKDGVISWICHSKTCNRRIRTQGPYVIEVSGTEHSSECLGLPVEQLYGSDSDESESTEEYYFGTSSRGNPVLVLSGHRFKLMKDKGKRKRWLYLNPVFAQSQRGNPVIMIVERLITERGATILVVAGEHFYKQKVRGPRTRWHCSKKTRMKCKAAITTVGDTVIRTYLHHSHDEYGNQVPPPPRLTLYKNIP
ncbi:unnamed protein product [Spodoptera littoralis]|uniref:FLYWCH-type domain-containing protein n=1 Tax=Spodoptera littoralis TaxID=7109 RepID=A0A9P0MW50_SPOLI|nr:unnamed protein product [Spodoptera littoralis]CAH1635566.1 unnamed protein product [Spodoptera littoralis]